MLRRKSRRFIVWFPQFSPRLLIPVTNKIVSPSKLTCLTCACLRTLLIGWKIPRNKSRFSGYYLYSVIMPLSLSTAIYSLLMLIQSPFYRMGIYNSKYKGFQNHLRWSYTSRKDQITAYRMLSNPCSILFNFWTTDYVFCRSSRIFRGVQRGKL